MEILISHIASETTVDDIYHFVLTEMRRWWLPFQKCEILDCAILEIYDEEAREYEYHGVVKLGDFKSAEEAIERLSGRILNNRPVRVREFSRRSPGDRRFINEEPFPAVDLDRRKPLDRRRPALRITRRGMSEPRQ